MTREEALELVRSDKAALKNLPAKFLVHQAPIMEGLSELT